MLRQKGVIIRLKFRSIPHRMCCGSCQEVVVRTLYRPLLLQWRVPV